MPDPLVILQRYYADHPQVLAILIAHSRAVADKALWIAAQQPHRTLDVRLIEEGAMLHDIGILHTDAPDIGCHGSQPYLCHGVLGAEMLRREGLFQHARICESHVGLGFSVEEIQARGLPLPVREMLPFSDEERVVCLADKFFSKSAKRPEDESSLEDVRATVEGWGEESLSRFDSLCVEWRVDRR